MNANVPPAMPLDTELQQAIAEHQAGRYLEAEEIYLSILQAQPYHAIANHNLGLLAGQVGQHEAGLLYLRKALSVNPDEGQFWLSYANGLLQAGQPDEALDIVDTAIGRGLDNDASQALRQQAQEAIALAAQSPSQHDVDQIVALYQGRDYVQMETACRQLLEKFPESPFGWSVLGTALQVQGKDALAVLQKTTELAPHDAEAHGNLGNAFQAIAQYERAIMCYQHALDIAPNFAEAHSNLGGALQALGRTEEAAQSYRQALKINPLYAMAHFNLGNTLKTLGDMTGAVTCYRSALEILPDDAELHCNLGNSLQALKQFDEATVSYRHAITLAPGYALAHSNLGAALHELGHDNAALASYQLAVQLNGTDAEFYNGLGLCLKSLNRLDDALEAFHLALKNDSFHIAAHTNLGSVLFALDRKEDAAASYRTMLSIAPDSVDTYNNLGLVLRALDQPEESAQLHRRAIELDPDNANTYRYLGDASLALRDFNTAIASFEQALTLAPECAETHNKLGIALQTANRGDEALLVYTKALDLSPLQASIHSNIGVVLQDQGRYEDALSSYRKAIELDATFAGAHMNMGITHRSMGRHDEAITDFRRALELKPDYIQAHTNLGATLCEKGLIKEAIDSCRTTLKLDPLNAQVYSNLLFCLSHQDYSDPSEMFAEHQGFADLFEAPLRATWPIHQNKLAPDRVLKIGFVSGDFNSHAVANFFVPVLDHLTHSPDLALYGYYNSPDSDPLTGKIRELFDHWCEVFHLSDAELAKQIENDGIDVLIDLSGHTAKNRLAAFAHKPAPLQASWIGYPGTTGLQAVDYYLSDSRRLPNGKYDAQFTENIVRMPVSAPFLPFGKAPAINPLPALSNGYLTFGSFNRPNKLSHNVVALWAQLLHALPDSKMLLGGLGDAKENSQLLAWFEQEGIPLERLSLHRRSNMAEYLALHHQVDICVNPFPYTGATTLLHALWMGVPTLTTTGPTIPSHGGASFLGHVGLDAFVAQNAAQFVQKGVFLASNISTLATIRADLRDRFQRSPVGHPEIVAAGLERAVRIMWQRLCADLPPAPIQVSIRDIANVVEEAIGV